MATTLLGHIERALRSWHRWLAAVCQEDGADVYCQWPYRGREETVICGREMYLRHSEEPSLTGPPRHENSRRIDSRTHETFQPPPSEVIQRFRFYSRVRQAGKSVSAFVVALRELTKYCNFGDSLDKALRDRIVGGINMSQHRRNSSASKSWPTREQ